jgi:hypothetical protein
MIKHAFSGIGKTNFSVLLGRSGAITELVTTVCANIFSDCPHLRVQECLVRGCSVLSAAVCSGTGRLTGSLFLRNETGYVRDAEVKPVSVAAVIVVLLRRGHSTSRLLSKRQRVS